MVYYKLDDPDNRQDFDQNLSALISKHRIQKLEYQLPDEYRLDEQLKAICKRLAIESAVTDTEHFLNERYAVRDFFGSKNYLMENFYRATRQRMGILINGDKPVGDKWNFDHDNRKRYDGKVPLVEPVIFDHDVSALKRLIDDQGVKYFGEVDAAHFGWPLSRKEVLMLLEHFCEYLLPYFGTYEDAMLQQNFSLYHSRMSFALNSKIISPGEVVARVLEQYQHNKRLITLPQVEGFVRQVIGWREFMRGVYWAKMPDYAQSNFFNHTRELPHWFWDGNTKMNCLHKCIGQSLDKAWAHHIQRLMVIGNFSLLAGMHPDEVDAWYLGVYIDAIQWVEITNTRGMSQFADGGVIASKPYVASAAYINKMSDYCQHCKYDYKKKYGENACPFNSLYWNFFGHNEAKLKGNQRIGMMYKIWEKFAPEEKQKILQQAADYLERIEEL